MNIKYGQKLVETTYYDSKPTTIERYISREEVTSDSEELAMFIKLQQENKGCKHIKFERDISSKGKRYVIKTWEV
jgi:hypothetical protein